MIAADTGSSPAARFGKNGKNKAGPPPALAPSNCIASSMLLAFSTFEAFETTVLPMSDPVHYVTDERGERTAVVLPISAYEKLLEDLADLAVVAERREEPTVPHEQFVSELRRDGIV